MPGHLVRTAVADRKRRQGNRQASHIACSALPATRIPFVQDDRGIIVPSVAMTLLQPAIFSSGGDPITTLIFTVCKFGEESRFRPNPPCRQYLVLLPQTLYENIKWRSPVSPLVCLGLG